jgi:predicted phage-related endonuclease
MEIAGDAAKWGNLLEPVIAQDWAEAHRARISPGHSRSVGDIWRCTPDFDVLDDSAAPGLEVKTAGLRMASRWGETGSDEIPEHYLVQVQAYLELLDAPAWHVAALIGGQERRDYRVVRDRDLGAAIREAGERFWRDHVVPERPPVDGSDQCREAIARLLPRADGVLRAASEAELGLVSAWREARLVAEGAEAEAAELGNRVRMAIAEADGIIGPFGKIYFKNVKGRTTTDYRGIAMEYLATLAPHQVADLLARYQTTGEPTRSLRPYFKD